MSLSPHPHIRPLHLSIAEDELWSDEETVTDPENAKVMFVKLSQVQSSHEDLLGAMEQIRSASADLSPQLQAQLGQLSQYSAALLGASSEFLNEVTLQQRKWQKLLRLNNTKRSQLEEQLRALAVEHSRLERNANKAQSKGALLTQAEYENSDDEFFDAEDGNDDSDGPPDYGGRELGPCCSTGQGMSLQPAQASPTCSTPCSRITSPARDICHPPARAPACC